MLTNWAKGWYIFQIKAASWDHASPFFWCDTNGRLKLSNSKCFAGWLIWLTYFSTYGGSVLFRLAIGIMDDKVPIKQKLMDFGYSILLTCLLILMMITLIKRKDIVHSVNLMLELDETLQSKLSYTVLCPVFLVISYVHYLVIFLV